MIRVQGLRKSFSGRAAVRDLSFAAPDGTITGMLGSNGAGKTTTLRMICGVLHPEAGSIEIDAIGAGGDPLLRQRHLGALLDHTGLYSRLTVRENLSYFARLREIPEESLTARVDDAVSMLGLRSIAERRAGGLSQGERMRTALGRAILHSPQNLILDEPTNGLDVPTVRLLRDLLKQLRGMGRCVLFSSHVLDEVCALCDRVIIVAAGRLVAEGSPEELCAVTGAANLEDAFVALTSRGSVC